MVMNITTTIKKDPHSELQIGAFTFVREQTGRIVLHVDVDSGLYPLRLTHEQTSMLAQWMRSLQEEATWS